MYITQEQAQLAIELLKEAPKILALAIANWGKNTAEAVYGQWALKRKKLLQEIEKDKPQTHGDKWRAMSDEQIADSISADGCSCCPLGDEMGGCVLGIDENLDNACKAKLMNWLKQEASK